MVDTGKQWSLKVSDLITCDLQVLTHFGAALGLLAGSLSNIVRYYWAKWTKKMTQNHTCTCLKKSIHIRQISIVNNGAISHNWAAIPSW